MEGVDFPISWHIEKNDVKRNNRNINIIQILSEIAHLVRWCLPIIREIESFHSELLNYQMVKLPEGDVQSISDVLCVERFLACPKMVPPNSHVTLLYWDKPLNQSAPCFPMGSEWIHTKKKMELFSLRPQDYHTKLSKIPAMVFLLTMSKMMGPRHGPFFTAPTGIGWPGWANHSKPQSLVRWAPGEGDFFSNGGKDHGKLTI